MALNKTLKKHKYKIQKIRRESVQSFYRWGKNIMGDARKLGLLEFGGYHMGVTRIWGILECEDTKILRIIRFCGY